MNFINRLKNAFSGRYGYDDLNRHTLILCVILSVIGLVYPLTVIAAVEAVLICIVIYRALSRNIYKRSSENRKYLSKISGIKNAFLRLKTRVKDRGKFRYFKCPNCKARIKMPKKKGKFDITCNNCRTVFRKEWK